MFANAFRTALRNLRHNRGFAGLNVVGLAIGFAVVLVIGTYVRGELVVDRFHEAADRIVRIEQRLLDEDGTSVLTGLTPGIVGPALEERVPGVAATVRVREMSPLLWVDQAVVEADHVLLADPSFFDVFTFPILGGDRTSPLAEPGTIVLTESLATVLYGSANVVGRTVQSEEGPLTVRAVMADVPARSHLRFDAVVPLATADWSTWWFESWTAGVFATYVLLGEPTTPEAFAEALPAFNAAAAREAGDESDFSPFSARPLTDVYMAEAEWSLTPSGSPETVRILSLIALFVLVVAAINFTNLATARSLDRAREVGVRKTLGALRGGLAGQFIAETVALALVALVAAAALAAVALPFLPALSGRSLSLVGLGPWWAGMLALAVLTGAVAGAYPALVLSGFRPAEVLKGRFSAGVRGAGLRRGLVAVQFAVSVALIAGAAIVYGQLNHMEGRDLGFDRGGDQTELVLLPAIDSTAVARMETLRSRLIDLPGVEGATAGLTVPTRSGSTAGGTMDGPDGAPREVTVDMVVADEAYADVYGLALVAGRLPRGGAEASDAAPRQYLVNERAAREAGFVDPGDALGTAAAFWGEEGEVVGVVRDFHLRGLHTDVRPVAVTTASGGFGGFFSVLTLRVRRAEMPETLAAVGDVWEGLVPTRPFTYEFLDDNFAAAYQAERSLAQLAALFAGLAVGVAVLGLFGLAAHAAQLRRKEIGVRRVLGASVADIVVRLTRGTVGLVAVGVAVAAPAVVWGMSRWLDGFAYRIDVGWEPVAVAGLAVLTVAVLTVGGLSARAAVSDPVRALRSE